MSTHSTTKATDNPSILGAARDMGAAFARLEHYLATTPQAKDAAYDAFTGPYAEQLREHFRLGYFHTQDAIWAAVGDTK